jgi:O-antigen/teichoic acid export membrane protein
MTNRNGFKHIAGETLCIGIGQLVAAVGSVLGVKLLTQVMHPATYGTFSLAIVTATLIHSVLWTPLAVAAHRFYSHYNEIGVPRTFLRCLNRFSKKIIYISTLIFIAVCLLPGLTFASWQYILLSLGTFVFTVFYGGSFVIDYIQNAARNRLLVSFHNSSFIMLYVWI